MIRLAFFDVDGTLSAPVYLVDGKYGPGMPGDDWVRYCVKYGADAYQWCKFIPAVKAYALKLKKAGARLFVLTSVETSFETEAKHKFIDTYYPGIFEKVISVSKDEYKFIVIDEMAKITGYALEECELVEDTFSTVLDVSLKGIKATHISDIVSVNP